MDTSEFYIKMMSTNRELLYWKWEQGFSEGDYIFDGKSTHILGHDYLGVKNFFKSKKDISPVYEPQLYQKCRIALYEPLEAVAITSDIPTIIEIKDGKYGLQTLYNAIWLPRQDQLQEMGGQPYSTFAKQLGLLAVFDDYSGPFKTYEQLWLAFVMKGKYGKVWDSEKEDWVKEKDDEPHIYSRESGT